MDTGFKKYVFKNPDKVLLGLFIVFWIAMGSIITILWNRYSMQNIDTARSQIQIIDNFLISINPKDTTYLSRAKNIVIENKDTPIEDIFFSIYSKDRTLLYTNATSSRHSDILAFNNINDSVKDCNIHKSYTETIYNEDLEKDYIITSTYSPLYERYLISECPISNNISIQGFFRYMPKKLSNIIILIIIANICMFFLRKHMINIAKLKYFIQQLGDENDIKLNDSKDNTRDIHELTNDLYTIYKNKIDIIKQNDIEREKAIINEKNRLYSKRTLANNLNHEIKTPIGIIIGYLDTLINHPDIDKQTQMSFLNKCLTNTQRLQNMVVNIAMINRIEDGSNNIALESVNMLKIAKIAKEDLKFTLEEYNMNFHNEISCDTIVKGNDTLLYTALCNLIKNSCYYSGGTDITLKIIAKDDDFYTFSFYDNGKGVPEESIHKLFSRFFRIEKDKNQKSGTGLGLSIVKESISLCGGNISVSNIKGGGLELVFTLPIPKIKKQ